jgi:hypothetical protein
MTVMLKWSHNVEWVDSKNNVRQEQVMLLSSTSRRHIRMEV